MTVTPGVSPSLPTTAERMPSKLSRSSTASATTTSSCRCSLPSRGSECAPALLKALCAGRDRRARDRDPVLPGKIYIGIDPKNDLHLSVHLSYRTVQADRCRAARFLRSV